MEIIMLGVIFLSVLFYLTFLSGKNSAIKEMEERKMKEEIIELKRQAEKNSMSI